MVITPAITTKSTTFPVFPVERITRRKTPPTTAPTPVDRPTNRHLGVALNEVFVPILQKQFPEIIDLYLPPEGCSYSMAVVSIKKQYPGHAKRVMLGVSSSCDSSCTPSS